MRCVIHVVIPSEYGTVNIFSMNLFLYLNQRRTSRAHGDWREAETTAARIHKARECVGNEACYKGTRNARPTGEDYRKQGFIHNVLFNYNMCAM